MPLLPSNRGGMMSLSPAVIPRVLGAGAVVTAVTVGVIALVTGVASGWAMAVVSFGGCRLSTYLGVVVVVTSAVGRHRLPSDRPGVPACGVAQPCLQRHNGRCNRPRVVVAPCRGGCSQRGRVVRRPSAGVRRGARCVRFGGVVRRCRSPRSSCPGASQTALDVRVRRGHPHPCGVAGSPGVVFGVLVERLHHRGRNIESFASPRAVHRCQPYSAPVCDRGVRLR